MKLRLNAYFVPGIILLVIVAILVVANVRPIHDQCSWQFPKILSCLLSARETLAAGLIGAGGAIFAAWLAWTAVREQVIHQIDMHLFRAVSIFLAYPS